MKIIVDDKAKQLRSLYINKYIDKEGDYYKNRILKLIECSDGFCYQGYLWDCLNSMQLISEMESEQYIKDFKNILIMWDINSKDYIFIPDYWKYPKEAILSLSAREYERYKHDLPEDIYIFDDTFTWSVILTHETTYEDERYCCFTHAEEKYEAFPNKPVYTKDELEG